MNKQAASKEQANRATVQRYFAAINNQHKTLEMLEHLVTDPDLVEHIAFFEAGFAGYALIPDEIIAEGDKVAVRFHTDQTHTGEFLGVAPTGRRTSVDGIIIYRLEDDKIAEHWMQADLLGLMRTLQEPQPVTG